MWVNGMWWSGVVWWCCGVGFVGVVVEWVGLVCYWCNCYSKSSELDSSVNLSRMVWYGMELFFNLGEP